MPAALAALAALWLAMLLAGGTAPDRALLVAGYAGGEPWLVAAAQAVTWFGDWRVLVPAIALGALWLAWRGRRRDALLFAAITLSGRLLVTLQKVLVARLRPDANEHLVTVTNLSFPSGHAANSMLVWLGLALLLPRDARSRTIAICAALALTLVVGLSRVLLGVHWPSDVLGGWSFGLFWTLLLLHLAGQFRTA